MAKYVNIKIQTENGQEDMSIRIVKQIGKFALHKKFGNNERGVYSITCLQTGTTILSHLEGLDNALSCLKQIDNDFPDFDFNNEDHKKEIWKYVKQRFLRKTIFG